MINHKFSLDKSFQEIWYRIENWSNEGSSWIVELVKSQYIKHFNLYTITWNALHKITCWIEKSKNGLINIKNNDKKCFLWCHVRHINPVKIHPERTTQNVKNLSMTLILMKLDFLCEKKILVNLKWKITFVLMFLVTKIDYLLQSEFRIKNMKIPWICCL